MDLANIIQSSLEAKTAPKSSENYVMKPGEEQIIIPENTTSGSTIQLPPNVSSNQQSLILPANFNTNGGPLLCQLDDNSYVLIEGLDTLATCASNTSHESNMVTSTSSTSSTTSSPPKVVSTHIISPNSSPLKSPASNVEAGPQVKTQVSPVAATIKKVATTPPKSIQSPTKVTTQPVTTLGTTFLVMSNAPINKSNLSNPTKDTTTSSSSSSFTKPSITLTSTGLSKSTTNTSIPKPITGLNNGPVKYILVPQNKASPGTISLRPNILSSGMKTITVNSPSGNLQTLNLPIGTNLVPTNKISTNKPIYTPKFGSPNIQQLLPPSKINLKVSSAQSAIIKSQPSQIGNIQTPDKTLMEYTSTKEGDSANLVINESVPSPRLFDDLMESNISEPKKPIFTYSKTQIKTAETQPQPNTIKPNVNSSPVITAPSVPKPPVSSSLLSQPIAIVGPSQGTMSFPSGRVNLPLQVITPGKPATILPNKRKALMSNPVNAKKRKEDPSDFPQIIKADGKTVTREVVTTLNFSATDKAIINTAFQELKKLFARRELILKQLNTSCLAMGKIEYKLTISGEPVDLKQMYARLSHFQHQFEQDLKRLDFACNAMHKLYTELAPKDEMRSIHDILHDLVGPTDGAEEDPQARYDRFKAQSPKKKTVRDSRPKIRISPPKRPKKTVFYEGEEGCPPPPLEERKVPEKPNESDGKWHCELCTKIFLKQISLAKHLEFDHPVSLELEKRLTTQRSPKAAHACQDCDRSFHSSVMLSIHRSNVHDTADSYDIGRTRTSTSKRDSVEDRLFSDDEATLSEDETRSRRNSQQTTSSQINTRNARAARRRTGRARKRVRPSRSTANNIKSKITESLDFLCDQSNSPKSQTMWREADIFDPDIPIECQDDNPIIPLKQLTPETIAAYTGGRYP